MEIKLRLRALNEHGEVISEGSVKIHNAAYNKLDLDSFKNLQKGESIAQQLKNIVETKLPPILSEILIRPSNMKSLLIEMSMGGRYFWYKKEM